MVNSIDFKQVYRYFSEFHIIFNCRLFKYAVENNNDYKYDLESILYAFVNKFLSGKDLERVKEKLKMTELGKSLINEGMEKGKDEGKKEKTIEIVKRAIKKGMDNETIKELTDLDIDEIELIRKVLK